MLSKRDRLSKHLAAARWFESLNDEELASVVASHYLEAYRAAPKGPERNELAEAARRTLLGAADRATSLGAHDQAVAHLEQALRVTTGDADQALLQEKIGRAAASAGQFEKAESQLRSAIAWYKKGSDTRGTDRCAAALGGALIGKSEVGEAIEVLKGALEAESTTGADRELVEVTAQLARSYFLHGEHAEAAVWADRALELADRLDLLSVIADALITKGSALNLIGRTYEGTALLRGALAFAEQAELPYPQSRALLNLSYVLINTDPAEALSFAKKGLEVSTRYGIRDAQLFLLGNALEFAFHTGEWDWVEEAIIQYGLPEDPKSFQEATIPLSYSLILSHRGEHQKAQRLLSKARTLRSDIPQEKVVVLLAESQVAMARGDLQQAWRKSMDPLVRRSEPSTAVNGFYLGGRAALWMRDPGLLTEALEGLVSARARGPFVEYAEYGMKGSLAALQDDRGEAVSWFTRAAIGWRSLSLLLELALCQTDVVIALGSTDPDASKAADEAYEILTALGARPFLELLQQQSHETLTPKS
jgi:tetratricopeptide (TPR) repeat protein